MTDFEKLNPRVVLIYFCYIIFIFMSCINPVLCPVHVIFSFLMGLCLRKDKILKTVKFNVFMGLALTFVNPIFSTGGETVLFTIFGRKYTAQRLIYGFVLACIFVSVVNRFTCLGRILTSDKFMYIFGGKFPNLCTLLTMTIGLIPFLQRKITEIKEARQNLSTQRGIKFAFECINIALSYGFEHRINLSFSMKNRAFGTGKATRYTNYAFKFWDTAFLFVSSLLFFALLFLRQNRLVNIEIIPKLIFPQITSKEITGLACEIALLALPILTAIIKEIKWKYSISKI